MDDTREGDPRFSLPPELRDRARRWFAEAREQTRKDGEGAAGRRRDNRPAGDGGGGGSASSIGCGGDGGGGDGGV